MENIFRCGYSKIYVSEVSALGSDFIEFNWRQSKGDKSVLHTSVCHISKIDIQKSLGHESGDMFEINGVQVNMAAYLKTFNLLIWQSNNT